MVTAKFRPSLLIAFIMSLLVSAIPLTTHAAPPSETPPVPQVVPPGPEPDSTWPVIGHWTQTHTDATGQSITETYIIRRKPEDRSESVETCSDTAIVPSSMIPNACTYVTTESSTKSTSVGGIEQNLKVTYNRYNGPSGYRSYLITEAREWWTRPNNTYSVGTNTTTWTYNGWDCNNSFSYGGTSANLTVGWVSSTQSYTYIYDFTKNWAIKSPGPFIGAGLIKVANTAPALQNGNQIGTLNTEVQLYGE